MPWARRQSGFTLLELLVVIMLIGLLTAIIATQGNWTLSEDGLDEEAARLHDTLELLNERSLFSGQLLALRLDSNGWTPLTYDRDDQDFVPIDDTSMKALNLPAGLSLEWQVDALGDDEVALSEVAKSLVEEEVMAAPDALGSNSTDSDETEKEEDDEKPFPQLFFFPSGEVTPVTITLLSNDDIDVFRRWQISALGQVTDPDNESPDKPNLPPEEAPTP